MNHHAQYAPRPRLRQAVGLLASLLCSSVRSAEPPILANLSFEQLAQIEVTTASKRPEPLARTPTAISVVSGEELRRSGSVSLPDALRYVPGMDVARISSASWGVGSRGFGGQFANQLLVMIDGRSVYDPAFRGVLWDSATVMLEDLDRIEVVRGPGGSLWGANAVNGVINILTKSAATPPAPCMVG